MSDIDALRKQLLVTERVNVAGGAGFEVRGVSLDAILRICRRHWGEMGQLFEQVMERADGGIGLDLNQAGDIASGLLESVPTIAAEIIAEAAGYSEPDAIELFRKIPAPSQLEALDKIAALTFTSEMPPKKVIEIVLRHLVGVKKTLIGNDQV